MNENNGELKDNFSNNGLDIGKTSFWFKYKWWTIGGIGLIVVIAVVLVLMFVLKEEKDYQLPDQTGLNQPVATKLNYTGRIYMAEINRTLLVGQEAKLDVLMDTNGTNIVAASFILNYDPEKVEILRVEKDRSVLSMDVIEELEDGQVEVVRGKPGDGNPRDHDDGFTGQRGVLATVVLKPKVAGIIELKFVADDTKMGVDDGKGTLARVEVGDGEYIVE